MTRRLLGWREGKGRLKTRSRFFAHHPRTYPTELRLCGAPGTFGAPFTQNDTMLIGAAWDPFSHDTTLVGVVGMKRAAEDKTQILRSPPPNLPHRAKA